MGRIEGERREARGYEMKGRVRWQRKRERERARHYKEGDRLKKGSEGEKNTHTCMTAHHIYLT